MASTHEYENLKAQGDSAYYEHKYLEALAFYENALAIAPENPEAYKNIGNAYLGKLLLDQAEVYYRKAIAQKADYWAAHNNMGLVCQKRQDHEAAIHYFQKALEIESDNYKTLAAMGMSFAILAQKEEACACFKKGISIAPHVYDIELELARSFIKWEEYEKARYLLEDLISRVPDKEIYNIHFCLAEMLFNQNEYALSAEQLIKVTELAPDYGYAFERLGFLYTLLGNYLKAVENYLIAASINPLRELRLGDNDYYNVIAKILYLEDPEQTGSSTLYETIIIGYENLLARHPHPEILHGRLSELHNIKKSYEKAIEHALKAIELSRNPLYYFQLSGAYFYLKKLDESIEALEKVAELDSENKLGFQKLAYASMVKVLAEKGELDLVEQYKQKISILNLI